MAKRNSDGEVKKTHLPLAWDIPELPAMTENPIEVNFKEYALAHSADVVITNGSLYASAHKSILSLCSSTLRDVLEGDATCKEVTVDASDAAFRAFYYTLYASPEQRKQDKRFPVTENTMRFVAQYDCKVMRSLMIFKIRNSYFVEGSEYVIHKSMALNLNLHDFAEEFEKAQIRFREAVKLETFDASLVVKMVQAHDFNKSFTFFHSILEYLTKVNNPHVRGLIFETSYNVTLQRKKWNAIEKYFIPPEADL